MIKFKPKNNNVIIKPKENSEEKHGNIIIPDLGKDVARSGYVIAVGPGMVTINGTLIPCEAKEGELVYFPLMGGQKLNVQGEEYYAFKDTDLLTGIEE